MANDVAGEVDGLDVLVCDRSLPEGDPSTLPPPPAAPDDPADLPVRWLFYTSGTTADPKGAQHTDRTVMAASSAVSAVTRSLANVFHRLWHEVMGFFFFVFSLIGALAVYREYRKYSVLTPHPSAGGLIAAGLFTLVFFYFCVSSFWRSRSRNQASGPPREDTGRKK